jgi:hypothetical protein
MDSQRVTLIGIKGTGPDDPSGRTEACELRIGQGGDITPDALQRILAAVQPEAYVYEDSRRHHNWGSTGLEGQEIAILYAIGVGAHVTADVLLEILGKRLGALMGPRVDDADVAWAMFQEFLLRAFKQPEAKLLSAVKEDDNWKLVAQVPRGRKYEGRVSKGGHVIEARRLDD